jgi:phage terminase large subunit
MDKAEVESNEIIFELATAKCAILLEPGRHKLLHGGRFSSKSHNAFRTAVALCCIVAMRILCTRAVQKSIRESSYRLICDIISEHGLSDMFRITRDEIRNIVTGSVFMFEGLQNTDNIKSKEKIDLCIVEEARTVTQKNILDLCPTIFRNAGAQIWWLWNPEDEDDAIEQYFRNPKNEPPPKCLFAEINYTDNPFLTESAIEEAEWMRKTNFPLYEHIFLGKFKPKNLNWDFINPAWLDRAFRGDCVKMEGMAAHWGAVGHDYADGGDDLAVSVEGVGNKVTRIDEFPYCDTIEMANKLVEAFTRLGRHSTVMGVDCNGPGAGVGHNLVKLHGIENLEKCIYKSEEYKTPEPVEFEFDCWRSQAWWQFRCDLERGNIDLSWVAQYYENAGLLRKEIMAHHHWVDKGKLRITPKKELKKADVLGWSPGRADSIVIWNWVRKRLVVGTEVDKSLFKGRDYDYGYEGQEQKGGWV